MLSQYLHNWHYSEMFVNIIELIIVGLNFKITKIILKPFKIKSNIENKEIFKHIF